MPCKHTDKTPGVTAIWRLDCYALPTEAEHFGFRDGMSHPAIEGSGIPGTNSKEQPLKAGEFLTGAPPRRDGRPSPDAAAGDRGGRGNGTAMEIFRTLHQRVAAFRQYLKANSSSSDAEDLLAAKMMGRWRSGAPGAGHDER